MPDAPLTRRRPSRRPLLLLVACLVAVAALAATAAACGSSSKAEQSKVAATVNGVPISSRDVDEVVAASGIGGKKISRRAALDVLVQQALIAAEAKRMDVSVSASDVDDRIGRIASSVGGQHALEQTLSTAGLDLAAYKRQLARSLLAERLAEVKYPKVVSTTASARQYYRTHRSQFTVPAQVKLGDIAVKAERIAENAIARIRQGQPFAQTARQFTFDPELKTASGQLGWVAVDGLPTSWRKALAKLDPGEVSAPTRAVNGWHVLKLYDRRPQTTYSFAKMRDDIARELTREKRAAALERWAAKARAKAQIDTTP